MDTIEYGRMLFRSAENIRRSSDSFDALLRNLWELLEQWPAP